jgi:polysaccharide pyruvyl transferase WcaK-like protein
MNYRGWRSDLEQRADFFNTYLKKITRFVIWLLDDGYHVRILTGQVTDQRAVDHLMKAVAAEGRTIALERLVAEPMQTLH